MKYVSLFSGIEAATVAWEPLGWEPVCFAEFDEFPSAVLADNDGRPQREHGDRTRHGGHAPCGRRRAVGVPVSACTLLVRCGCAGGVKERW